MYGSKLLTANVYTISSVQILTDEATRKLGISRHSEDPKKVSLEASALQVEFCQKVHKQRNIFFYGVHGSVMYATLLKPAM